MSITVTGTINKSNFAVAYFDATALVLDALSLSGQDRRDKLDRAQDRLKAALKYADGVLGSEWMLVRQLQETIKLYERKGWDRA